MEAMDKCSSEPSEMLEGDVMVGAALPPSSDGDGDGDVSQRSAQASPVPYASIVPLSSRGVGGGVGDGVGPRIRVRRAALPPSSDGDGDVSQRRNPFIRGSMLELNVVTVRRKISAGQTNAHQAVEGDEENISEAEAVCKFCFRKFGEEDGLKTKCGCTNKAYAHEECEANWSSKKGNNNCDYCRVGVENLPVSFASRPASTQGDIGTGSHEKKKKKKKKKRN